MPGIEINARTVAFVAGGLALLLTLIVLAPLDWRIAMALFLAYGAGYSYRSALD